MIETAMDEKLLKPVTKRKIIHEYGEPLECQIQVYALEEIVAEKTARHSPASAETGRKGMEPLTSPRLL